MTDMIGPGGKDGCSKINCLKNAINQYTYAVAYPTRDVYDVIYRWCEEHDHTLDSYVYPNFELKEVKSCRTDQLS